MAARRGDPAYWGSSEEAYLAGREQGFDRGYEEGAAVSRPRPVAAAVAPPSPALTERRAVELGLLAVIAYGLWRFLRTWPGRLVGAGVLVAASGLVSIGLVVLAVLVCALALGWAAKTGERTVSDVRSGVRHLRAARRTYAARRAR